MLEEDAPQNQRWFLFISAMSRWSRLKDVSLSHFVSNILQMSSICPLQHVCYLSFEIHFHHLADTFVQNDLQWETQLSHHVSEIHEKYYFTGLTWTWTLTKNAQLWRRSEVGYKQESWRWEEIRHSFDFSHDSKILNIKMINKYDWAVMITQGPCTRSL